MRRALFLAAALSLATSTMAPRAFAGDAAAAEALFQQGRAASDKGDYETACQKFAESNRLDPAVGTVFNLGDCEEKRGRLATAWQYFREVVQKLPANDERVPIATKRAAALEPRIPKLTVRLVGTTTSAKVVRDGVELGPASLGTPLPVDPGTHTVVVSVPGHTDATFTMEVREKDVKTLDVSPGPEDRAAASGSTSTPTKDGGTPPANGNKTLGIALVAVGGAALVTGGVLGAIVLGKKSTADDNCPDKRCNQTGIDAANTGSKLAPWSTIGLVTGVIAGGVGAYFLVSSSSGGRETAIIPTIGPTASHISFRQRW